MSAARPLYFGSRTWLDVPEGWTLREAHAQVRRTNAAAMWDRRARIVLVQMRADVAEFGPITVVEGEADGLDILSRIVAVHLGQAHDPYPVNLDVDGPWPAAGHRRNERQGRDGKPTCGRGFITGDVGTPLSRGSAGMLAILQRLRLPVVLHRDNGVEVVS